MSISSRIHDTIEDWVVEWRDRLRGWMSSWLSKGVTEFIEFIEPDAIADMTFILNKIKEDPHTPDDIKGLMDKLLTPGHPIPLLILIPLAVLMLVPLVSGISQPLGRILQYVQDRILHSYRIDPLAVIVAWRRDPEKYAYLIDDLKDQGWSDDRIEALKFFTLIYPSRQDLQRYTAKEALEPEAISKYGLMDEFDRLDLTLFDKIGVERETARLDWIAHWEHASWMQVVEMLHRGLITESEVWDWFRLVEIPPFWRQLLIDTAYTWPTRVDVRR